MRISVVAHPFPLSRFLAVLFLFVLIVNIGCCGSDGPHLIDVRGTVTFEGQPVTIGHISFIPTTGGQPAIGEFNAEGNYRLKSHAGRSGIEPGDYNVVLQSYEGSFIENNVRYIVPEEFSRVETSGLSAAIPSDASGELEFNFNLP